MKTRICLLLVFLWSAASAQAAVWQTRQRWSPRWEKAYQNWVAEHWHKNYFVQPGPYQGLKFDCADLVYSMRAVFAAENALPFVINDPTGGRGYISNEMSRFDSLPSSQRKRAFLNYLHGVVSTKSLPQDSYPAAVDRHSLSSGSFLLTDEESHHSWTVKKFLPTGIPFLLFSSRPAKTVLLQRQEYPSMPFTFPNGLKPERHAGFRNFRQMKDLKKPVWQVPGYSLEQYRISYNSWRSTMQARMSLRGETSEEMLQRLLGSACSGSQERIVAVREALNQLRKMDREGRRCMTQSEYDDYSTPSRDKRLIGNFMDVVDAYNHLRRTGRLGNGRYARITATLLKGRSAGYCDLEIAGLGRLSFGHVIASGLAGGLSSNPHDSLKARWGLEDWPGGRARSCPTY